MAANGIHINIGVDALSKMMKGEECDDVVAQITEKTLHELCRRRGELVTTKLATIVDKFYDELVNKMIVSADNSNKQVLAESFQKIIEDEVNTLFKDKVNDIISELDLRAMINTLVDERMSLIQHVLMPLIKERLDDILAESIENLLKNRLEK